MSQYRTSSHEVWVDEVRTGSGSMKGLSRKKYHLSRQEFLAASHSTHPKLLNVHEYTFIDLVLRSLF